ncbi:MAG TPA: PHP-associated domain-containing protein, partial [Candidatus Moranbacteria bacterium]|nr:PHP-associated domain-containing protein [Candidatus Moranbacteria bacterium]
LEECFHEQTEFIYAYETGLSSDPEMNSRLSALAKLTCLSNSDAHSLENIGREANVMELTSASYENIYQIIKGKKRLVAGDVEGMIETIEFYPEEGMYHLDGHRDCHFSCNPEESRRLHNLCPHCGRPLDLLLNKNYLNRISLEILELSLHSEMIIPESAGYEHGLVIEILFSVAKCISSDA